MTLAELQERTLRRLNDNTTAPASVSLAEVTAALNRALRLFSTLTLCVERTTQLSFTAGSPWSHLSDRLSDWWLPLRVGLIPPVETPGVWDRSVFDAQLFDELAPANGPSTQVRPARLAELDALSRTWQLETGDTTKRYGIVGWDLLYLYPAPATEINLEFIYAAVARAMAGLTEEPEIAAEWHPVLPECAAVLLRLRDGGAELKRVLPGLDVFLDAAARCADRVRARSRSLRYDRLPAELALFDRSRKDLAKLLEAMKEKPAKERAKS